MRGYLRGSGYSSPQQATAGKAPSSCSHIGGSPRPIYFSLYALAPPQGHVQLRQSCIQQVVGTAGYTGEGLVTFSAPQGGEVSMTRLAEINLLQGDATEFPKMAIPWFRRVVLNLWVTASMGITYPISCITDICIMIHNRKVTVIQ